VSLRPSLQMTQCGVRREALYVKVELRAITNSHLNRESAAMIILDHPVGEILLLRVSAHVLERQDGDGAFRTPVVGAWG
jgi:hypothetical protein